MAMKDENDSYLKPGQKDENDSYVGTMPVKKPIPKPIPKPGRQRITSDDAKGMKPYVSKPGRQRITSDDAKGMKPYVSKQKALKKFISKSSMK